MKDYGEIRLKLPFGVLGMQEVSFDWSLENGRCKVKTVYMRISEVEKSNNWVCIDDVIDDEVVERVETLVDRQFEENRNAEAEFELDFRRDESMIKKWRI